MISDEFTNLVIEALKAGMETRWYKFNKKQTKTGHRIIEIKFLKTDRTEPIPLLWDQQIHTLKTFFPSLRLWISCPEKNVLHMMIINIDPETYEKGYSTIKKFEKKLKALARKMKD